MARVRLIWVWLIALMVAVMAGCGGDDSQTPEPGDAASDRRTDAVTSDVRIDTPPSSDVRVDTPIDTRSEPPTTTDVRVDTPVTPDAPVDTPRPPDADAGRPDIRQDQPNPPPDATDAPNPPPPDATDAPNPPPPDVTDAPIPPDTGDVFRCTADNQCPSGAPHCNTTTGACVSVTSIAVTPATPSVALGVPQQFTATATYSDSSTSNVSATATWTSSNATVATVSATGLASTHAAGSTTITATLGTASANATLTVTAKELVSIQLDPPTPSKPKGLTQQFTATGTYTDNTTADLTSVATWTSATTAAVTIDAGGLATAVDIGSSVITAESGGKQGTTTMTVTSATLVSLAVTPQAPSIPAQTIRPFVVTGTYTDNTTQNLTTQATWTSSNLAVATISNDPGSQGWATGVGAGTSTITAAFGGQQATSTLTVTGATLVSINVIPDTPTAAKGFVVSFTATGVYDDNSTQTLTQNVTWTSSDVGVATIGDTLGSKGVATCVDQGTTTITAALGGISGTTVLTVTAATLQSISIAPTAPSIAKGTNQQFIATGTYSDFSTANITESVTWGSTNAGVAPISNAVGTKGRATGQAVGQTTISATLSGVSQTTTLNVTNATLTAIGIEPTNPSIAKGNSIQFKAIGTYTDLTTQDLTTQVAWNSSNNAYATISNAAGSEGLANGADVGTATITATLGQTAGTTELTVTAATLSTIAITPPNPSIAKGTTQAFTAIGTYSDNTTQDLTQLASWSSNNGGVASVSNNAGTRGVATGKNVGSATITANYLGVSGSTLLTVSTATLVSIAVTPTNWSVPAGTVVQYHATGTYTDNSTQDLTTQVAWDSSGSAVATIITGGGSSGSATTLMAGETDITATLGPVSGQTHLTVTIADLVSIAITPPNPAIAKGTKQQFIATGTYSDNTTQDVTALASWSSSDSSKATISNSSPTKGEATGVNTGTGIVITATFNGVSGTTLLDVTNAALVSIAVTPAGQSIAAGTTLQYTAIGTYSDSSTQDLTTQATWASSGAAADISNAVGSKGLATGQSAGSVTITATFASIPGTTGLTVTNATLNSIDVTTPTPGIAKGTTAQFTATGHYSNGTTQDLTAQVTWGSLSPSVATVSNAVGSKGLASGANAGSATITAAMNGVTGQTTLTVTSATLTSISVLPASGAISVGQTRQYQAIGTYSDTTTQDITLLVTWGTSDGAIAQISNAAGSRGLATALAQGGPIDITAMMSSNTGTAQLTVNP